MHHGTPPPQHMPRVQVPMQPRPPIHQPNSYVDRSLQQGGAQSYQFQVGGNVSGGPSTPTGTLTYATLLPSKAHSGLSPGYNTVAGPQYEEIVAHEPSDPGKRPLRSAMKGSKQKALLHQQLAQQLRQKQIDMGTTPGNRTSGPPVAPKPRIRTSANG